MRTGSEEDDYEARVLESPPRRPPPPPPPRAALSSARSQLRREEGQQQQQQQAQHPPPPPPPQAPQTPPPQQQQMQRPEEPPARPRQPQTPQREEQQQPQQQQQQQQRQEPQQEQEEQQQRQDWILHVRLPPQQRASYGQVRKIHVTPDIMTVETLAACLQQSLSLDYDVYGLFDSDEMFVSLQYILSMQSSQRKGIFAIELEPPPPVRAQPPWWHILPNLFTYVLIPITAIVILYYHGETVLSMIGNSAAAFYNMTIEWPLIQLYRTGPWFLGAWEGESLPSICARITYHGDAAFWARNMVECQRIFSAKQTAFLQLATPIVYLILLLVTVIVVRLFLLWRREHAAARAGPMEREMADLYRAFHTILRQIQRVTTTTTSQHHHGGGGHARRH